MIPLMGESPPFAGIASFFKAPYLADPKSADADVAILGIPYDEATTARPGARYGPRAMRDASTNWAYRDGVTPFYDGETGAQLLDGVRFVDSGDVDLPPTAQPERSHPLIGARVGRLLEHELFPVVLGGDHSITYPILKAFGGRRLHLVQFDTHMDYWNDEGGMLYTHASPIVRSHESGLATRVTQYGIRGLHTAADQIELAGERGVTTFWCEQAKRTPVESSSPTSCRAKTSTSRSTSTRSTRASRRAPARPSPAASPTTRPRRSCGRSRCGPT